MCAYNLFTAEAQRTQRYAEKIRHHRKFRGLAICTFLVMMPEMSTTSRQPQPEVSSISEIRQHFPALERTHNGYPVAYFDGPGGTQVPRSVVDAMSQYLFHHNANTHWVYPTSEETDALITQSRRTIATFLNAEPDEIAFGANMTTLTFHLARALARGWKAG